MSITIETERLTPTQNPSELLNVPDEDLSTEAVEKKHEVIKDSGNRRKFETGAVRDMAKGKGRMDLAPLDILALFLGVDPIEYLGDFELDNEFLMITPYEDPVLVKLNYYKETGNPAGLVAALAEAINPMHEGRKLMFYDRAIDAGVDLEWHNPSTCLLNNNWTRDKLELYKKLAATLVLEVGKHFEAGAEKYGIDNWKLGIETKCYIDSAVRHYVKWLRGDDDEPHDRAFAWNVICCLWSHYHLPKCESYKKVYDKKEGEAEK